MKDTKDSEPEKEPSATFHRLDDNIPATADLASYTPPANIDPEKYSTGLISEIKSLPEAKKIKPLKELAFIGGLDCLKDILPLSQYSSEFVRRVARNTAAKIILRTLRENEGQPLSEIRQKSSLIDFLIGLDSKYAHLKENEIGNPKVKKKIFDILIREDKSFTAQTLAEIIGDSDAQVRATAIKLIAGMIEERETHIFLKLLNDPDARVRANVIESLEAVGNPNVLGILMKYKMDADNRVRANTLKALWNLGYKDIEGNLSEMLFNEDPAMRASAVWVIGETGHNQSSLKELFKIVQNDKNDMVRINLERARKKISWLEKGLRVLVIDDDKEFLKELFRKLARDGFHVLASFDGKAGAHTALNQKPDIILMDLRIPEINGLEVLKILKDSETTKHIPVIVMCDFNLSGLIKRSSEAGAADYLIKPFDYGQLVEKLKLHASS